MQSDIKHKPNIEVRGSLSLLKLLSFYLLNVLTGISYKEVMEKTQFISSVHSLEIPLIWLKSKHPYSNLWFFQRILGIIGVFLNSLGKFTFNLLKPEQCAFSGLTFI